jgi:hypothetical protein
MTKRLNFQTLLVLAYLSVVLCCCFGCKKENNTNATDNTTLAEDNGGTNNTGENPNEPEDTTAFLSCTLNGAPFVADTVTIEESGELRIFTAIKGTRKVKLYTTFRAPSMSAMNMDDPAIYFIQGNITYNPAFTNTGSLVVADTTGHRLSGTFVANVQDIAVTGASVALTNGVFRNLPF